MPVAVTGWQLAEDDSDPATEWAWAAWENRGGGRKAEAMGGPRKVKEKEKEKKKREKKRKGKEKGGVGLGQVDLQLRCNALTLSCKTI